MHQMDVHGLFDTEPGSEPVMLVADASNRALGRYFSQGKDYYKTMIPAGFHWKRIILRMTRRCWLMNYAAPTLCNRLSEMKGGW